MTDTRRPALVTEDFRARVAAVLAPLGFEALAHNKALVRKRGKNAHRIVFRSSHSNEPGYAACFVELLFEDGATRKLVKGWRAGGELNASVLALSAPTNVAEPREADTIVALIQEQLSMFDWLEDPPTVLREVSRRFARGLVEPRMIAPYLRAHLGEEAVVAYVRSLVSGLPELAPAMFSELEQLERQAEGVVLDDHGTQLALALRTWAPSASLERPAGVAISTSMTARHVRCSLGRQLRAWGEVEAARALRGIGDEAILAAHRAQNALRWNTVDSIRSARVAVEVATGEDRPPRRRRPEPLYYQYEVHHTEPFAPA